MMMPLRPGPGRECPARKTLAIGYMQILHSSSHAVSSVHAMPSRVGVVHVQVPPTHWCDVSQVSIVLVVVVCDPVIPAVVADGSEPDSSAAESFESSPLSSPPQDADTSSKDARSRSERVMCAESAAGPKRRASRHLRPRRRCS